MGDYDPGMPVLRQLLALSIIKKLDECGFKLELEDKGFAGREVERIYTRPVEGEKDMQIKVYTTVVGGGEGRDIEVRANGKDAIRVCATYKTKSGAERGLVKETRVNRTGNIDDIVDRMYSRMRTAYKLASSGEKCPKCGAPKFRAKSGKLCCAEICWKTDEQKARDDHAYKVSKGRRRRHRWMK